LIAASMLKVPVGGSATVASAWITQKTLGKVN
jgi:hypothetical protein